MNDSSGSMLGGPAEELATRLADAPERADHRSYLRRIGAVRASMDAVAVALDSKAAGARSGAAEWLADNRYLVNDALKQVRSDLPPGFLARLPAVRSGRETHPRISLVASAVLQGSQSHLDPDTVLRFLAAFQNVTELTTGELWALPTFLRLAVLEDLAQNGESLIGGAAVSSEEEARVHDRVAAGIGSLRIFATHDWKSFFESASLVEHTLSRGDPAGVYPLMDFETRDAYRRSVEAVARRAQIPESQVAQLALEEASTREAGTNHVGFALEGDGIQLEDALSYRPSVRERLSRALVAARPSVYFSSCIIATALTAVLISWPILRDGVSWLSALALLLSLIPGASVAISTINWISSHLVKPKTLPKLDLEQGIPRELRTVVAVPVLLGDAIDLEHLTRQLEMNYEGNEDPSLRFALLTDLADAPNQTMPNDRAIIDRAVEAVQNLNARRTKTPGDGGPFLLLHRERQWNPSQECWMGWERKRGKLEQLNELILGQADPAFSCLVGRQRDLVGAQFVITLDADTILPPGAAARLVGAIGHPLNQPVFRDDGRLARGFTVLQPRIETIPTVAVQTRFARIFEADRGLDLYSHAVSDVYQDLFGEGIFAGKGIYHVEAFHQTLVGRVPENRILSHDLFEGAHGRAGLVSDVAVFEEYPSDFISYSKRLHRWVRGDWQILPWLLPSVQGRGGEKLRNRLSFLDRWKIGDNLRRSLLFPSVMLLLLLGWALSPTLVWWWSAVAIAVLGTPVILGAATAVRARSRLSGRHAHFAGVPPSPPAAVQRLALALFFLPYHASIEIDAIVRTVYRLTRSRTKLLEWTTASQTERAARSRGAAHYWHQMAVGPGVGFIALLVFASTDAPGKWAVLPFALGWLVSPAVAHWASVQSLPTSQSLKEEDVRALRHVARRTWAFFERFVGPDDHWLPPDNFQEDPLGVAAHRTSPTNTGLMLLSYLGAHDLGYVPVTHLTAALSNTFQTLERLPRHRGHFLNWYDTRQLTPLDPLYVSTVDSGNFIGSLVALRAGLEAITEERVGAQLHKGLNDSLAVLRSQILKLDLAGEDEALTAVVKELVEFLSEPELDEARPSDADALAALAHRVEEVENRISAIVESRRLRLDEACLPDVTLWLRLTHEHLTRARHEAESVLPWIFPAAQPPALANRESGEVAAALQALEEMRSTRPKWQDVPAVVEKLGSVLGGLAHALDEADHEAATEAHRWVADMAERVLEAGRVTSAVLADIETVVSACDQLIAETDFSFLYDRQRRLFHIGYNLSSGELDSSYYDLLASEARLASFLAIAKGDAPLKHWLHLGRPFGKAPGGAVLLSWSGTMFEYLMPALLMRTPERSLIGLSCRASTNLQASYGRLRRTPWGISESAFYQTDAQSVYQYRAFGVPDLGLRQDPGDRLVVAPYASMLALQIDPQPVMKNLRRLEADGMLGPLGLYEALDYGAGGSEDLAHPRVVRSYMSHHQGMILIALVNALRDDLMVERFHRSPEVAAADFLLFEQVPSRVRLDVREPEPPTSTEQVGSAGPLVPWAVSSEAVPPSLHVLSNGTLSALVASDASGGLRWGGSAITRWQADPVPGRWGSWVYFRDMNDGRIWSAGAAPCRDEGAALRTRFSAHMAEFQRVQNGISARMEITVPPTSDVEIRLLTLCNVSDQPRRIRVASYGELVLANPEEDRRHPAFAKLFVETSVVPHPAALIHNRRTSDPHQAVCTAHAIGFESPSVQLVGGWTDRRAFIGRGGTLRRPKGLMSDPRPLEDLDGDSLDPIHALAADVELEPGDEAQLAILTAVGTSRARVLDTVKEFRSTARVGWAFEQARTRSMVQLQSLDIAPQDSERFQQLLSAALLPFGSPVPAQSRQVNGGQQALWSLGISGDLPIVMIRVARHDDTPPLLELLRAHAYWESIRVELDLVVLDYDVDGYAQPLRSWLNGALTRMGRADRQNRPGGVHYVPEGRLNSNVSAAIHALSSVVLDTAEGPLPHQIRRLGTQEATLPPFVPVPRPEQPEASAIPRPKGLLLDNGLGGFSEDGRAYLIYLGHGEETPAPWINVLAGPEFGALVSDRGGGYTWTVNSAESRLTTWTNDPVLDRPGEAIYLRDEESGAVWSPTPGPAPAGPPYLVRHEAGTSVYTHCSHGLETETRISSLSEEQVRVTTVRLRNRWDRPRRLTLTYFAEWVLGNDRCREAHHITTRIDEDAGIITAHNNFRAAAPPLVAFLGSTEPLHSATCDRIEFLGIGDLGCPTGLSRIGLSKRCGLGLDPCGALQVHVDLDAAGEQELSFFLGASDDEQKANATVEGLKSKGAVERALARVLGSWDSLLDTVQVNTPSLSLDLMVNRWLLYQSMACRVWGRSALYQSSGAFGFRDQLQDVLAFPLAAPEVARQQILEAAGHQFPEGDVLHWWHPPDDRGVRTRCSDDLLWLPYVVSGYVAATGDSGILDEVVHYLKGEPLRDRELQRFGIYPSAAASGTLYDHCLRALRYAQSRTGSHGLPLIGTGDWNDSFDALGPEGRGESVWLAWFIHDVVRRFGPLMTARGDVDLAAELEGWANALGRAAEEHAWDGAWYRRATNDNGDWIGTATGAEGQIDSLTQSWAVISRGASERRQRVAMDSVLEHLVDEEAGIVKLLTPPFQHMDPTPGYARNYPPGVRENGGQYTHAAAWVAWALADLGDGDEAARILGLLNPAERTRDRDAVEHYLREPYAVAADVYGFGTLTGVGGWSWYTGSAAWLYRLAVERILGIQPVAGGIHLDPCIPTAWPGYRLTIRRGTGTIYRLDVKNPDAVGRGIRSVTVDGAPIEGAQIEFVEDGREHDVEVTLGVAALATTGGMLTTDPRRG